MNPIETAVSPRRTANVERAVGIASRRVELAMEDLAAAGFDLNVAAPMPNGMMGRAQYRQAQALRVFLSSITERVSESPCRARFDPVIVRRSEAGVAHYLAAVADAAGAEFDAYVAKLSAKVGATVSASLDDAPLWNGSRLSVVLPDGTAQVWKTSMILNVSVLGKLFNQWPTRLVSSTPAIAAARGAA